MKIRTYLQYKHVHGRPSTQTDLRTALASLDRSGMLRLLSEIAFSLDFLTSGSSEEAQRTAVQRFFPQSLAVQILARGIAVFHRHQLLFLMQETMKHGRDSWDGNSVQPTELGEIFLMANDLLYQPTQTSSSKNAGMLQQILDLLPVSEANLFTSALLKMGRAHLMVTRFAEARRGQPGFFDIPLLFRKATGVSFKTFEALMAGVFTRLVNPRRLGGTIEFGLPLSFFDQVPIERDEVSAFFRMIASTPKQCAEEIAATNPRPNDFRIIRDKPLVQIGDRCFPLDQHSGLEKFETGVYWSIFQHLPEEQKKSFPSFWGHIFEDYALWLLAESCDGKRDRLYKNPRYCRHPQHEVCDAIVVCRRTAVFIEIKGSTITSEGKYASDVDKLEGEIEKKYVGTKGNPKGVRQLVAAIQNTCRYESPCPIQDVDLGSVSTVIPLLITRDDIGGYFGVNAYLKARFKEVLGPAHYRPSITPCLCICSDTLEKLTPYLSDTSLADILSSRMRADKELAAPFFTRIGSILHRKNKGGPDRQPTLLKEATLAVKDIAQEVYGVRAGTAGE